jgi:PAS domain-containing protein
MGDPVFLHRLQFAFTIIYHYLFPVLTMGLAFLIFLMKALGLRRGGERWNDATRFWIRVFGINFTLGIVTGIPMEFQFGTNWARFSRYAGKSRRLGASEQALRKSESRMTLAADAAKLGFWVWDVGSDEFWMTDRARALGGNAPAERINFRRFLATVHPDDRDRVRRSFEGTLEDRSDFEREYRVVRETSASYSRRSTASRSTWGQGTSSLLADSGVWRLGPRHVAGRAHHSRRRRPGIRHPWKSLVDPVAGSLTGAGSG